MMHAFYERLIKYIEARECPEGVFYDISKALDCMDQDELLNKLCDYGIRGIPLA